MSRSRQTRLILGAILAAGLAPGQAFATDFKTIDDRVSLVTGKDLNGRLQGAVPVPEGAPVILRVRRGQGRGAVLTFPRDRVTGIAYRGDVMFEEVNALYKRGAVEESYEALRRLDVAQPGWRAKDPLRLEIALTWGAKLSESGLAAQAALVYRRAGRDFKSPELEARAIAALAEVADQTYAKRDYPAFKRLLAEIELLSTAAPRLKELRDRFDADFERRLSEAQGAERQGEKRRALEFYEEALRMRSGRSDLRARVTELRKIYQRFHYGEPTRVLGFDPITCRSPAERRIQQFLFSGLVRHRRDPRAQVASTYELDLARKITLSRDGRRVYIDLRKDARWSNGQPVTVQDVLATLRALCSEKTDERDAVLARRLDLDQTRARGPGRLVLQLRFATPRPRMLLDFPILPADALGADPTMRRGSEFSRRPVGSGAFIFDQRSGNETILSSNRHFKAPGSDGASGPVLAEVRQTSFADPTTARVRLENNQIDLLTQLHPADVVRFEASGRFRVKHFAMNEVSFLAFNHRREAIGGPRGLYLRRGINLAIDRPKLLVEHYQAKKGVRSAHRLITGPFPRGSWAYNDAVPGYGFRPKLAIQTLRASGLRDLTLKLIHPPDPIVTAVCSVMKKQIQDAGADINLRVRLTKLTPALFRKALEKRAFDLAYCSFTFDRPIFDLEPLLGDRETGVGGRNYMGYRHPDLARLFDDLRLTDLWTRITTLNREIHRHLHENAAMVPLWQLDSYYAYTEKLRDFETHPVHLFGSPWALRLR